MDRFDGEIGFNSVFGQGTTFHYSFVLEEIRDPEEETRLAMEKYKSQKREDKSNDGSRVASRGSTNSFNNLKCTELGTNDIASVFEQVPKIRSYGKQRVLIVDDEPYCLLGLRNQLAKKIDVEARCDQALSGDEAI